MKNLTRIKGLKIRQVFEPNSNDDNHAYSGLRLMYSIDGCKWKIFGARPKKQHGTVSNDTSESVIQPQPTTQVMWVSISFRFSRLNFIKWFSICNV